MNFDAGPLGCFMQIFSSLRCSGLVIALDLLFFIFQLHYETMILSVEFTVKEKLQRKRNAFPLKQWQCVLNFLSLSSTSFDYTHMTSYVNYPSVPDFAGDKSIAFDSSEVLGFFNSHE